MPKFKVVYKGGKEVIINEKSLAKAEEVANRKYKTWIDIIRVRKET